MAKFKVGDRVKTLERFSFDPNEGIIKEISGDLFMVEVPTQEKGYNWHYYKDNLELVSKKRGRPSKPQQVKYIAFYDKQDQNPAKKFYSKKELTDWLKEARDDEDIIFDSIEVYPVKDKPLKPKLYVRLK